MAEGASAFLGKMLRGAIATVTKKVPSSRDQITHGKTPKDIPAHRISPLSDVMTRFTGPGAGVAGVHPSTEGEVSCNVCCESWNDRHERADGAAVSLYDREKATGHQSGEPVADVFGVVSYRNGGLLAVADGVNWGQKSRLAARCAVHGSLGYLEEHIKSALTTQEVIAYLLRSFDNAQTLILKENGTLTTLVTCCVCQLVDGRWVVCAVNVGDSFAYVYSSQNGSVREVTVFSHQGERDMRLAGGTLGPFDGYSPDLGNLTCSFTFVEPDEILFATSDGVYDNFDPVVLKRATPSSKDESDALPFMTQLERDDAGAKLMGVILRRETPTGFVRNASDVSMSLLRYVVSLTEGKRRVFEEMMDSNKQEISARTRELPGKLDHATVGALQVGFFPTDPSEEQKKKCATLALELGNL